MVFEHSELFSFVFFLQISFLNNVTLWTLNIDSYFESLAGANFSIIDDRSAAIDFHIIIIIAIISIVSCVVA